MTGSDRGAGVECAIIVVTYNSAGDIDGLLDSIPHAANGVRCRTIVVDNGSTDDTVARVSARPDVTCLRAHGNLGYAAAINLGREHAGEREAVLVLNPDLELEAGAIDHLMGALRTTGAGIAAPALLGAEHQVLPSIRREPSVTRALGDALLGGHARQRPSWASEIVWDGPQYQRPGEIAWATGAAWLIADACDCAVGRWNESFFLYSEEVDYADRARRRGFRFVFVPDARAVHHEGGSGRSPDLTALLAVNRVRYFRARHGRLASACFRACVIVNELLRAWDAEHRVALAELLRDDPDPLVRRLRAAGTS